MYLLYFAINVKVPKDPKTLKASNDPKNLRTFRDLRTLRVLKAPTHHIPHCPPESGGQATLGAKRVCKRRGYVNGGGM